MAKIPQGVWWGLSAFIATQAFAELRKMGQYSFVGKTVVISGGSRGLGLIMARKFAQKGANLVLVARDQTELERASADISQIGKTTGILCVAADVTDQAQVKKVISQSIDRFGQIDVLINDAGLMRVGAFEDLDIKDFEDSMKIHLFAPLYFVKAALPYLKESRGRIVNISSIGGKVAIPHMSAYSASKFALTGLSESLHSELAKDGICVTTVCPGTMRTGSIGAAEFKGEAEKEYEWFAASASLPGISISAESAADQVIEACAQGKAEVVISPPAQIAASLQQNFPNAAQLLFAMVNRLLPQAQFDKEAPLGKGSAGQSGEAVKGSQIQPPSWFPLAITFLSRMAASRNNEPRTNS